MFGVTRFGLILALLLPVGGLAAEPDREAARLLDRLDVKSGICVVAGKVDEAVLLKMVEQSELLFYATISDDELASSLQQAAADAGLLGTRVYVDQGDRIHLAPNLADAAIAINADDSSLLKQLSAVVHPGGNVLFNDAIHTKPRPDGADDWSHPYHGPDNNPQSTDQNAKAPYLTQFLAEPWYVPMPQVTVASGGRVFKAFGHIALKKREWPWLNSLVAINAYNGTHLWKRDLKPGFMIHRNTLIATPNTVYLGDDESCKLIDAATGKVRDEIKIAKAVDPDGVWKWMALEDGVLYALVGQKELIDTVIRGTRPVPGWPWSGLGAAYGGKYSWGFGRTLLAIDPQTKAVLWSYRSDDPVDSRVMCLADGRIYAYCHQKHLTCISSEDGSTLWCSENKAMLDAIGEHDRAQTASKGFASTAYAKANEHGIYFAGPQRTKLVGVSAKSGSLLWSYPHGNFQLVLRDDGLYAMGRMQTSKKFDYLTGEVLADLECYRGNCTRATGTIDSIFTRGYRHTGTMRLDLSGTDARRIPLMRPACQDGVIVNEGLLYWGPWMCDCNHTLIGMICLGSAGDHDFDAVATNETRLEFTDAQEVAVGDTSTSDWTSYRANASRTGNSTATVPTTTSVSWTFESESGVEPTAPVTAGELAIWSGLGGVVRAVDIGSGKQAWRAFTGGAVRFPPEVWGGRVYVGSGDGYVYCFAMETGQQLWRFRAAPEDRRIAVHGKLLSNWPVGSGVLVHDGVVYAAAGITSYDGTHVYALDAVTGELVWQNNTSGRLVDDQQVTGVSVQGHLLLRDDKLYLAGGNVVSPAVYDATNGKCLNELDNEWWARPEDSTEKFPSKPTREMFKRSPRGRELFFVDGEVRVFDQLLYSPPKYGQSRYFGGHFLQVASDDMTIRATNDRVVRLANQKAADGKPIGIWQSASFNDPRAMALCQNAVVVTGELKTEATDEDAEPQYAVAAFRLDDGKQLWSHSLAAEPVSWGLAVDRSGRSIVTLADGRVQCVNEE